MKCISSPIKLLQVMRQLCCLVERLKLKASLQRKQSDNMGSAWSLGQHRKPIGKVNFPSLLTFHSHCPQLTLEVDHWEITGNYKDRQWLLRNDRQLRMRSVLQAAREGWSSLPTKEDIKKWQSNWPLLLQGSFPCKYKILSGKQTIYPSFLPPFICLLPTFSYLTLPLFYFCIYTVNTYWMIAVGWAFGRNWGLCRKQGKHVPHSQHSCAKGSGWRRCRHAINKQTPADFTSCWVWGKKSAGWWGGGLCLKQGWVRRRGGESEGF